MNAWGAIVIAVGGGVVWWAVKHQGSLSDLAGLGALGLAAKSLGSSGGAIPPPTNESGKGGKTPTEEPTSPEPAPAPEPVDPLPVEVPIP